MMQCKKRGCWDTREKDGEDSLVILEEKPEEGDNESNRKEKKMILEDRNKICKETAAGMGVESDEESRRLNFSKHYTRKQNHLPDYLQEPNQDSNTHN